MLLVSGATKTVKRLSPHANLGALLTPRGSHDPLVFERRGIVYAADNSAFSNFDEPKFMHMLTRLQQRATNCLWVTAPDVVGDAASTLAKWPKWHDIIRLYGQKPAFVGQDGLDIRDVPWSTMDAFFVGGSTAWKMGDSAKDIVRECKRREILVHMGRVNSMRRIKHAFDSGVDSVDGSGYSMFPDTYIPRALQYLNELDRQNRLPMAV